MAQDRDYLTRSNESLQENLDRAEPGIAASYLMIGAILALGAAGYFCDRWLNTAPWLLLVGLVAGLLVGFSGLARVVWRNSVR